MLCPGTDEKGEKMGFCMLQGPVEESRSSRVGKDTFLNREVKGI